MDLTALLTSPDALGRPRRRIYRLVDGVVYYCCYCPKHKGAWVSADKFRLRKDRLRSGGISYYASYMCREGLNRIGRERRRPHLDIQGNVPVADVLKWVWEIRSYCNSWKHAAEVIGVDKITIYNWLSGSRYNVRASNAAKVFRTLHGLRSGTLQVSEIKSRGGRPSRYECRGCGGRLQRGLYTPGCRHCWDRRTKYERRAAAAAESGDHAGIAIV